MKGYSYVDFAVGASILVLLLALASSQMGRPSATSEGKAEVVFRAFFSGPGLPADWEKKGYSLFPGLMGNIYRVPVLLEESNVTSQTSSVLFGISLGEKASRGSIRSFDGSDNVPLELASYSDADNDGLLESANMKLQATIPAGGRKVVEIFYSGDVVDPQYTTITASAGSIKATPLGEEAIEGVYYSKLNGLGGYDELRGKTGIAWNFRLSVRNDTSVEWSYGPQPKGDVERKSAIRAVQDRTGKIRYVEVAAEVW